MIENIGTRFISGYWLGYFSMGFINRVRIPIVPTYKKA